MKTRIFILGLFLMAAVSCSSDKVSLIETKSGAAGKKVVLSVEKGSEWNHMMMGVISTTPQIAVWIEDLDGNMVETLYVTAKYGKGTWFGAATRVSSVPYWGFKMAGGGAKAPYAPTKYTPMPDTVTSASPEGSFVLKSVATKPLESFAVLAEFNNSLDFNDTYKDGLPKDSPYYSGAGGDGGQPSIVYKAIITPADGTNWATLVMAGHSSPSGADAGLYTNMEGLTTGVKMVKTVVFRLAE
ncbi:MAG: hypothetical protein HPY53_03455 [Brevinematales bacterium]|nr:hypothetical protein [Brevinematales bacterium]